MTREAKRLSREQSVGDYWLGVVVSVSISCLVWAEVVPLRKVPSGQSSRDVPVPQLQGGLHLLGGGSWGWSRHVAQCLRGPMHIRTHPPLLLAPEHEAPRLNARLPSGLAPSWRVAFSSPSTCAQGRGRGCSLFGRMGPDIF